MVHNLAITVEGLVTEISSLEVRISGFRGLVSFGGFTGRP
jgi:hypothetical protein